MRVSFPDDAFLHIDINGRHLDELLYSGKSIRTSEHSLVYFPPLTALNGGDDRDGEEAFGLQYPSV